MKKSTITTYGEAADYLLQIPRFTTKNTMEDTGRFLEALGSPDKTMRIIHVAGTNGKGSVCAYLRGMLEAAGNKVSVFTSPHLVDMRERFVTGGKMVSEEDFLQAFLTVYHKLDWEMLERGEGYHPTFFEYLFFMAMLIFGKEKPDWCILETGLGGRLDATNAVERKELAVITRIGKDHVQYLGDTIEAIAGEKAGIMKAGAPVVFLDTCKNSTEVFCKQAEKIGISAYPLSKKDYRLLNFHNKNIDFSLQSQYYGYIRLTLHSAALYQVENAALAVRALEILDRGRTVTQDMIREGLEAAVWQGRMEEVLPGVLVDGAHNEDGIRAFLESVRADGFSHRRRLLFGVVQDKDYTGMLEALIDSGLFREIAVTRLHSGRAASLDALEQVLKKHPRCAYTLYQETEAAFRSLLGAHGEGERLYIAGSLYLVGEIKELLRNDKL